MPMPDCFLPDEHMFTLPHDLGDYTLNKALGIKFGRTVYLAEQKGTGRQVLLDLLYEKESTSEEIENFLEDVRVKTKVSGQLPFLGTVYEAQKKDGYIFFTYQNPSGENLKQIVNEQQTLSTELLLRILDVIARASKGFERLDVANKPVSLEQIKIRENNLVFMENTAVRGNRPADGSRRDLEHTAKLLRPLVTTGTPGATRLQTLFNWMIDGAEGEPIGWEQVHELVQTVQEQLGLVPIAGSYMMDNQPAKTKKYILAGGIVLVFASLVTILILQMPEEDPPPPPRPKPTLSPRDHTDVKVFLTPDSAPIMCDAHEVTIKAYKRFLDSLDKIPEEVRLKEYAHPDQPADKTSYVPQDWDAILAAVDNDETWNDMDVSLASPVFNIDWWDAYAYAKWKNRRLPTKDEWQEIAKLVKTGGKGDPYGPVSEYSNDMGADNLCGFASGVSEWTDTVEKNPNQPMEPPQHVICGGDYTAPSLQQIKYEPGPNFKSDKTGFRTVSVQEPSN